MINIGQIWREKDLPSWRKNNADTFVVCNVEYSISVIYKDGKTDYVGREWIKEDCELVAEYPTWQQAVNSSKFRGEK